MNRRLPPAVVQEGVTAVVKWYNPTKGFGFVRTGDDAPDAFLHISVVQRAGLTAIPEGATIVCDLAEGNKGLQVSEIQSVDTSTARMRETEETGETDMSEHEGTVKFYNADKGYGFVVIEDKGQDAFLSARILSRCGIDTLEPEQKVRITVKAGAKGLTVEGIELA